MQCYFSAKDGRITRAGTEKKEKWSTWAPFMSEHSMVSKREKSPVATLRLVQGDRLAVYPLTMAELHEYLSGAKFKAQAADVHRCDSNARQIYQSEATKRLSRRASGHHARAVG
jgi:hypothetical protein